MYIDKKATELFNFSAPYCTYVLFMLLCIIARRYWTNFMSFFFSIFYPFDQSKINNSNNNNGDDDEDDDGADDNKIMSRSNINIGKAQLRVRRDKSSETT